MGGIWRVCKMHRFRFANKKGSEGDTVEIKVERSPGEFGAKIYYFSLNYDFEESTEVRNIKVSGVLEGSVCDYSDSSSCNEAISDVGECYRNDWEYLYDDLNIKILNSGKSFMP
ncbi:hypothetical protein GW923_02815 [Candidatus Pacearchaeota archaeon]|nr:hypothetical protein [Candidatus Pacearchaeota archaeon]